MLAGCASAPDAETPTPAGNETFAVELTGDPARTYVVAARLVAEPFENVTVTYANGSTRRIAAPDRLGAVAFGPESNVTDVDPGGDTVGGAFFEGSPNFTVTDDGVPPTGNVVYTVREKREGSGTNATVLTAWGLIRCDGHVTELSLRVGESGVEGAGFGCES